MCLSAKVCRPSFSRSSWLVRTVRWEIGPPMVESFSPFQPTEPTIHGTCQHFSRLLRQAVRVWSSGTYLSTPYCRYDIADPRVIIMPIVIPLPPLFQPSFFPVNAFFFLFPRIFFKNFIFFSSAVFFHSPLHRPTFFQKFDRLDEQVACTGLSDKIDT